MDAQTDNALQVAELETERLQLSDVSPHPGNPRIHSKEQIEAIKESLRLDGYIAGTMGVQRSSRRLYKGHGVYEALLGLGCIEADFVVKDLSDAETLALLARDNALSDMSGNDPQKLKAISVELQEMSVPIKRMGYTMKEINALQPAKEVTEDEPPPVSEDEPVTQTGDLWLLGEHRVLCGDSTKAEDVERVMDGEKADMVFTDPPYGVKYGDKLNASNPITHRVRSIQNDDLDDDELEGLIRSAYVNISKCSVPGCALYAASPPGKPLPVAIAAFTGSGFEFRWQLVWVKNTLVLSRADYHFRHENILYGWKPDGSHYFIDDRKQDSVFEYDRPSTSPEHPTMKPVGLVARIVTNSTEEGSLVFDPFLGSGTTLIAADQLDRRCYGLEIAPKYCDVIVKRYINHVGTDEDVYVERDGKRLSWDELNGHVQIAGQNVHVM